MRGVWPGSQPAGRCPGLDGDGQVLSWEPCVGGLVPLPHPRFLPSGLGRPGVGADPSGPPQGQRWHEADGPAMGACLGV